jgi:two-component system chemotaxis response regulator CheY
LGPGCAWRPTIFVGAIAGLLSIAFTQPQLERGFLRPPVIRHPVGLRMPANLSKKDFERLLQSLTVLVIDDNPFMRRMIRTLLMNIGVKDVHEAVDGITGLQAIRTVTPDLVILDWEMPFLNGAEMVRIVRSPGVFPVPDVPIIMLSGYAERWRVMDAVRLGVNEFLIKPVSAKALLDRITSILALPRPAVQLGDYYGPKPRDRANRPGRRTAEGPAILPAAPAHQRIAGA